MMRFMGSVFFSIVLLFFLPACKEQKTVPQDSVVVTNVNKMDFTVKEMISKILDGADDKTGKINDSVRFKAIGLMKYIYTKNAYEPLWSSAEEWGPNTIPFVHYLDTIHRQGLLKNEYLYNKLFNIKRLIEKDSLKKKDAVLWAKADLMLTNAFVCVMQDLKQGRLVSDSSKLLFNEDNFEPFFAKNINEYLAGKPLSAVMDSLHPKSKAYKELKAALRGFADSMDTKSYTYLVFPYKDSLDFLKKLKIRLSESGIGTAGGSLPDSAGLATLIKTYQKKKNQKQDGKLNAALVRMLNNYDLEKFRRIAVNLDRYKLMPASLPSKYIWVNLPSYNLRLVDADTLVLSSKVICGKPETPTPLLNSLITDMVLNPTWTVPSSIIEKEMLPGLKRNPGYLSRRGLYLLNGKGEKIDPYSINWSKYKKGIPYRIQQGSGDNNALGVIKFNFDNKYSVYLHDTNVRGLFKRTVRSLSHGCVRVQDWKGIAKYLAINDSLNLKQGDTLRYTTDSIWTWLNAGAYRKVIVQNKIPLFIKYFTVEGVNGKLKFYDDIYGDDRALREKYFATK